MENNTPNTNNFLNWVDIKNFKSIKDLHLDCKRVNVFIGKPNVGKSNILEGLGLLGAGYDTGKFLRGAVRYTDIRQLFWDNDISKYIKVTTDKHEAYMFGLPTLSIVTNDNNKVESPKIYAISVGNGISKDIDSSGYANNAHFYNPQKDEVANLTKRIDEINKKLQVVKKYDFANLTEFNGSVQDYLLPSSGTNLYSVVRRNKELWAEFAKLFAEQKLEFVLYDEKQEFILQKKDGPFVVQYPFFSIANTFRRFMFYITAIESNKNSVIIFEEPEVHLFPPYTQDVAYRMIYSEENQFFVSTHSPYLLQTLVSNLSDDQLNVFVTYYENYETKVKALTPEEVGFVQEYSTDVFFNLDRFVPDAQSANPA